MSNAGDEDDARTQDSMWSLFHDRQHDSLRGHGAEDDEAAAVSAPHDTEANNALHNENTDFPFSPDGDGLRGNGLSNFNGRNSNGGSSEFERESVPIVGHEFQDQHTYREPGFPAVIDNESHEQDQSQARGAIDTDDDEQPIISLSLIQFVARAKFLAEQGQSIDQTADFCKFVLNGTYNGKQYQVDPIKDVVRSSDRILAQRDYDSVIGISDHIYLDSNITVYPVPRKEDTLTRNIHIKRSFVNLHGVHERVPLHHIPNLCIGKWASDRNMIRVFIPGLYTPNRKQSQLDQTELAKFYELGLRPAIQAISHATASEWPPSYDGEMFRARGKRGTLSFQTKTLGNWHVQELGDALREALRENDVAWGEGIQFLFQIKGVKASNVHRTSALSAGVALTELLNHNSVGRDAVSFGEWWVDVGLELSTGGQECLAWRTDHHFHIVRDVLSIADNKAQRITSPGSSKYIRDLTSHLTAVSGCRITPGVLARGPHEAVYLQMYTTDKAVTYRPDGTHFGKFLTGGDILDGKADAYCRGLYDLYKDAANKNNGHARIEVRVPLRYADVVLTEVEDNIDVFISSLVCFPSTVWWGLRAYRAQAILNILEQQSNGDGRLRSNDAALLLTASVPWILNGLHSTPDNGSCSRDLINKILPLVNRDEVDVDCLVYPLSTRARPLHMEEEEEEEEEEEADLEQQGEENDDNISVDSSRSAPVPRNPPLVAAGGNLNRVPYVPFGLIFLRELRIGVGVTVPRFRDRSTPMVSRKTLMFIFKRSPESIIDALRNEGLVVPRNPDRAPNRMRRTTRRIPPSNTERPLFNLESRGVEVLPIPIDTGSDLGDNSGEEGAPADENIDTRLSNLWLQFLLDLTAKAPNPKSNRSPSYCVLTAAERLSVNEDTYRNLRLRDYFRDCQYRSATREEWHSAFDKAFPASPSVVQGTQNFPSMQYFAAWRSLVTDLSEMPTGHLMFNTIREELSARFSHLYWIPNVQGDRVWWTKPADTRSAFRYLNGSTARVPAPRILIRWGKTPILT